MSRPRSLELTASDELVALENLDVLRVNGFEVVADGHGHDSSSLDRMDVDLEDTGERGERAEDRDRDEDTVQWIPSDRSGNDKKRNGRLQLVAHPISKNTVFDLSGAFVPLFSFLFTDMHRLGRIATSYERPTIYF